ncbi:anti-anti-sigma factor [Amycolatopsis xylanica]|uniref:Anti-sigma factor antagonist n=1 Tax=Amycolatopsis xylanica TaxID=589385 RepID=A0A1H3G163_9PSEU|nr:STAS domain-containing protein [Amycolatopsis xylanica]SDX96976.1 anti-anti-sigma factor [Amycolatopsis xylanica]
MVAELFEVTLEKGETVTTVTARGEIDLISTPELENALRTALDAARPPMTVVADLAGVTFLSSSGMSALIQAHQSGQEQGVPVSIVVEQRAVLRALTAAGLDQLLDIVSRDARDPA